MGAYRIRVAKDKADLVTSLTSSDNKTGVFRHFTDVLVFAAALGARRKKRVPLGAISKTEPGPIDIDTFVTKGYDLVIKLLAIAETKDSKIIAPNDPDSEEIRAQIFEEYANGGLEILREELRGAVDYTERILLILLSERFKKTSSEPDEFDLSRFL
ncbi:DNA phosphorothioation-associated protein 4 [Phormidium pseudopriestleyi FRX01]|uniref:DNA phosphorothioation-associated protein 4 n=1 Tax=Phormidium pseudopriestleyi FRX01 TaxID=1759528 RepID=A0ABS3FU13_9CYAN|nr:DNA phosphorothioation-associated protein 4 [Phormidium pseudopriestleyi]MBO0350600.1 DNA phosphorothioation-associated protein 4 [Phormidium pseudopriestleyi FRX01]